jgi:hypothetical protein
MAKRFSTLSWVILTSSLLVLSVSTAQAGPQIAPKSGAAMCGGLSIADFQSVGIQTVSLPKANVQDNGASAYCVYAGKSSATGGLELDVFYPAGANPTEVKATEETAIGESSSVLKAIQIAGTDDARWSPNAVSGGPPFATITVQRANLVFVLGIPAGKNAQAQLLKLTDIVLKRF